MKRWTVGDVMTRDVVSVGEKTTYRELVQTLAAKGISAVPVLNPAGRVAGVVSEADLLHKVEFAGAQEHPKGLGGLIRRAARVKSEADSAADLMSAPAITARPGTSLTEAVKLLDSNNIKRLPVVDEDGNLVGIVSRADLLRIHTRTDEEILDEIRERVLSQTLWIDPKSLDVTVTAGLVGLGGQVDRKSTATIVEHLCSTVAGVVDVRNELTWEFDDTEMNEAGFYRTHPFSGPR
jgi:CBS domain-containing protein